MAEFGARSAQVVRPKPCDAHFLRILPYNVPDDTFCRAVTPTFSGSADTSEYFPVRDSGRRNPEIDRHLYPIRHRNGSNMAGFPDQINDRPMFLALLQVRECQICQFATPETTAK
jgi:hypothetical protein